MSRLIQVSGLSAVGVFAACLLMASCGSAGSPGTSTTTTPAAAAPTQAPAAAFSGTRTTPWNLTVAFSDTSTGSPSTWAWDFGDGTTSTQQSPVHMYAASGTFTATLVASNAMGQSRTTRSVTVSGGAEVTLCDGGRPTVAVLVDAALRPALAATLQRYAADLCGEGYRVWLTEFIGANPPAIREYLAGAWDRSAHTLNGALLVGDIPHAYQYVSAVSANPSIPSLREEVISFQYYADLNGTFSASSGYVGGHPYSYDVHSGEMNWEIWIGVLPVYKGSITQTTDALLQYFDKNHAYRTGAAKPPRAYVEVNELHNASNPAEEAAIITGMRNGLYSWTPFSNSASASFYFSGVTSGHSIADGYVAARSGVADFVVGDSHGGYLAAGQLTLASVEAVPLKTNFFWSSGCAIGDLDRSDNVLTSIVYGKNSAVLIGKGTTNDSGGMGNNTQGFYGHNVATAMTAGASFGNAILAHVNVPLISPWSLSREFHFGTVLIVGDPTLKLRQ